MKPTSWIAATALVFALAACSSGAHALTVADAREWATLSEAEHLTTRLVALVGQAERSIHTVNAQDLRTQTGKNFLSGVQTSWQNVIAQTYNFTGEVGQAVPSMASTIGDVHAAAVQWLNAVNQAQQEIASGKRIRTFAPIGQRYVNEGDLESSLRSSFLRTTGQLALGLCHLEQRYPALASNDSAAAECAAAHQLGQSP